MRTATGNETDPCSTPPAHTSLGTVLSKMGDPDGAIAHHQEAIRLDLRYPLAHNNLGHALRAKGDLEGAARCFRAMIRLDPKHAGAHCNLGVVLRHQGQFGESLAAFQKGHALGSRFPGWRQPSAHWDRLAEALVEREPFLAAVRSGAASPATAEEFVLFVQMSHCTGHHAAATRLYVAAFALWPRLAADPAAGQRYNAAGYAALAGCGHGADAPTDPVGRARLRHQALAWLRADLAFWSRQAGARDPRIRNVLRQKMQDWQRDRNLAGVRDPDALAKLPDAEHQDWEKLWADVDALRRRAGS